MSTYKTTTLINPNSKHIFGGAHLDIWSGYDIKFAVFQEKFDQGDASKPSGYRIVALDKYERAYYGKPMSREQFFDYYWQLIRRGWRVTKNNQKIPK